MFRTMFVFAGREVCQTHESLVAALMYARHVLVEWQTPPCVYIHGSYRDSYPLLYTVKR